MQKNNELFTTMPVRRAVAKLAVPTVISQIVVILYSLADTFFVGQIGDPNQLAAQSITFPIFTLLTAVANLFGIGANSVIARSLGKNDESTAKKASSQISVKFASSRVTRRSRMICVIPCRQGFRKMQGKSSSISAMSGILTQ